MTESNDIPASKADLHRLVAESEQAVLICIDSEENLRKKLLDTDSISFDEAMKLTEGLRVAFKSFKIAIRKEAHNKLMDVM